MTHKLDPQVDRLTCEHELKIEDASFIKNNLLNLVKVTLIKLFFTCTIVHMGMKIDIFDIDT